MTKEELRNKLVELEEQKSRIREQLKDLDRKPSDSLREMIGKFYLYEDDSTKILLHPMDINRRTPTFPYKFTGTHAMFSPIIARIERNALISIDMISRSREISVSEFTARLADMVEPVLVTINTQIQELKGISSDS